ncbi:MAG TPA: TonB-dependent receptor [Edaphocola sp.]|nr:TonB-dependent receptor [Edaphocola sp.]
MSIKSFKINRNFKIAISATAIIALLTNHSWGQGKNKPVDSLEKALEEVVVTAQYRPQSVRKSVYQMSIINQKRIQAKAVSNTQQILSGELGIRFNNDLALGTSDISFLGMSGRSIKILLDGVPVLDRGDIRESLNQLNPGQIERIEIVEGPMSIVYGADALAGIINIITKQPNKHKIQIGAQVSEETAAKEYQAMVGKGLHTQQVNGSWSNGKFSVLASVLHYDFSGYGADSFGRNQIWKPKEQLLPSISLGYKDDNWNINYRNDYLLETIYTLGKINLDVYRASNQFFTTSKMGHQLSANRPIGKKWFINSSASYTDFRRYTKTDILDYNKKTITRSLAPGDNDTAIFNAFNFRAAAIYYASKKLSFQPGIEYNYDKASGERIEGTPQVNNISAFLTAEYKPVSNFNLKPGIRITKNSLYDAPPIIPAINALYQVNDEISIRGSYAQGYRAPALRELYFVFKDANHSIVGNPDLKAEASKSFNLSFAYKKPTAKSRIYSTDLNLFYNNFNNLIDNAVSSTNSQEYTFVNINKYKTAGIGITNKFISKKLDWTIGGLLLGQFNDVPATDSVNASIKGFNWAPEFNMELMYHILATKTKLNLFYKFTGKRTSYVALGEKNGVMELALGTRSAYSTIDFNIQQEIAKGLNVFFGVRNLLDVTDIQNSLPSGGSHSGVSNIPFSYGRSYFVTLNYNFLKNLK